ncbi:hypothetical protein [Anaplasma phagocytophilum]|nr:hypothetical protein [Anaplasma phagocytophilum]
MHSSMGPISKTYRVYSSVEGNLESGKLTKRTVALYCSWLLEKSLDDLRKVVEAPKEGAIIPSLVKVALKNVKGVHDDICKAREGAASDITKTLVDGGDDLLSKLRTALLYLAHTRSELLPNEGTAGASVTALSAASYNVASALSILQSNISLPDKASTETRDRLCMLLDSLSGSVEIIPNDALKRSLRGATGGFVSPSEVKGALLLAIEELRSMVYTMHNGADKDARGSVQGALEVLMNPIKRVVGEISQRPGIDSRTSWSCALVAQLMDNIQEGFEGYANDTHTWDFAVPDEKCIRSNVTCAFASARRLLASCISVPPEERPLSYKHIVQCGGRLYDVYSFLGTCESIDLTNPQNVDNILPALNEARKALNKVAPSDLPGDRDAEAYARVREALSQACQRCNIRQFEHDTLDPAPSTGQNDLSIEGLEAASASHDLHH